MYVVTTEKQGRHVYFHIGAWEEEAPCVCVCVYGAFFYWIYQDVAIALLNFEFKKYFFTI